MLVFGRETTCNFGFLCPYIQPFFKTISSSQAKQKQSTTLGKSQENSQPWMKGILGRLFPLQAPHFGMTNRRERSLFYLAHVNPAWNSTTPPPPKSHNTSRRIIHCLKHGAKVGPLPTENKPINSCHLFIIFLEKWRKINWKSHGSMGRFYVPYILYLREWDISMKHVGK